MLLLGEQPPAHEHVAYHVFTQHPRALSRKLADLVFSIDPDFATRYVQAIPKLAGELYEVWLVDRPLCIMQMLPKTHGVASMNIIRPQKCKGLHGNQLLCLGPELQLIRTYGQLCNPALASDWETLEAQAAELGTMVRPAADLVAGGREAPEEPLSAAGLLRVVLRKYKQSESHAVLDYNPGAPRLRMVGCVPLDEEEKTMRQYLHDHPSLPYLRFTRTLLQIPTEPWMERLTVSIEHGPRSVRKRTPVLDIYNIGTREPVSYTHLRAHET